MYKLLYVMSLLIFIVCLYPAMAQDLNNSSEPVVTPVVTPTIISDITPAVNVTPSFTPTIIPDITPAVSVTPAITPSITVTPAVTPVITPDITPSITVTPSATPAITPTITPSVTPVVTATATPAITPTAAGKPDPNSLNVYIEQGNKYLKEGKYKLAKGEYEKAININDKLPGVWYNVGFIFESEGDLQSAAQSYKNYLVLSPGAKDAKYMAAHLFDMEGENLYQNGDYMGALEKFKESVKVDPAYPYAYFNQGLAYDKLEEYDLATKAYEQAVKYSPSYGNAHFNLALHYEFAGNYKGAINHYQAYLKLFPKAKDTKEVKAWIEELKSKI
ncbi:MAG: tetratricopeptide repeat protein [Candidatus Eremiobacterota bacterium]